MLIYTITYFYGLNLTIFVSSFVSFRVFFSTFLFSYIKDDLPLLQSMRIRKCEFRFVSTRFLWPQ